MENRHTSDRYPEMRQGCPGTGLPRLLLSPHHLCFDSEVAEGTITAQEPTQAHAAPATRVLERKMWIEEPSMLIPRLAIVATTMVVARALVAIEHIQLKICLLVSQINKEPRAPTKNDTKVSQLSDWIEGYQAGVGTGQLQVRTSLVQALTLTILEYAVGAVAAFLLKPLPHPMFPRGLHQSQRVYQPRKMTVKGILVSLTEMSSGAYTLRPRRLVMKK